jgi:hypothetical protein
MNTIGKHEHKKIMNKYLHIVLSFGLFVSFGLSAKSNTGLGRRAEAVADLLDGIDNFYIYNGRGGFQTVLNALKADWYNGIGADGANWVLAIVKKESATVFPPGTTAFEVPNPALGRTYDAVVTGTPNKYFEFKSVQNLPPSNFADQFIKDLNNPDITNLNQLKWMFDKAKYLKKAGNTEATFVSDMKRAIDNLSDTSLEILLPKFGANSAIQLKNILKNNISQIFNLK